MSPTIFGVGLVFLALAYQFLRRHRNAPGKPPMVSHLFPWIGSMFSIAKDPDRFFRDASNMVGANGVFGVMVGGNTKYYITDATVSPPFLIFGSRCSALSSIVDQGSVQERQGEHLAFSPVTTAVISQFHSVVCVFSHPTRIYNEHLWYAP
jgi:hypothetical protein